MKSLYRKKVRKQNLKSVNKMRLRKGDIVRAVKRVDLEDGNVPEGAYGIVIARANHYGDASLPEVKWFGGRRCGVCRGEVERHLSRKEWRDLA